MTQTYFDHDGWVKNTPKLCHLNPKYKNRWSEFQIQTSSDTSNVLKYKKNLFFPNELTQKFSHLEMKSRHIIPKKRRRNKKHLYKSEMTVLPLFVLSTAKRIQKICTNHFVCYIYIHTYIFFFLSYISLICS